jgi:CcmD family protein
MNLSPCVVWQRCMVLLMGLLLAVPALADEAPAAVTRDLSRYKEQAVNGELLLLIAYSILWLLIAGFAWRLAGKQARTEAQLAALQRRLDGSPAGGDAP